VYGKLEWNTGKICDGGRDLEGMELVEYCDNLFFDACEVGLCKVDRRAGGDVISGGKGGWFGFEDGEETGDGEVAGETVSIVGDMTAAILASRLDSLNRCASRSTAVNELIGGDGKVL